VRADPGDAAEQDNGERRDRPNDKLDPAGMGEIGKILRSRIGLPEPKCNRKDGDDGRHHDRQHDRNGIDQDDLVGRRNRTLWIENIHQRPVAAAATDMQSLTGK